MPKKVLLLALIALLVCGTIVTAEDEMCVPMGEITIEKLAPAASRSQVAFQHTVHFSYACQRCHHKWDGQTPIVSCQTSGCHDLGVKPDTRDAGQLARYYKDAYHDMCIGCHKQLKREYEAKEASAMGVDEKLPLPGPTSCVGCHPKE